jgi:hypothetical protein
MKEEDAGIGRRPKVANNVRLDIGMSNDAVHPVWTPGFTPHGLASSSVRK